MPFLLITLQSSHIFFTEARTFIESLFILISQNRNKAPFLFSH